ncbi:MAG TPA: D-glycero-beta-D-manno-heptose 1-phosphate adenylyltransferase, partial [Pirellulales bacterium]|nr:D-glycero-beta-D-manno-heptose 1-phosphate adenylyltransferase [Pirellulales bacterium]
MSQHIEQFSKLNALVIGEAMLDSYSRGVSGRLCPEAPVPVVDIRRRLDFPGGAANAAANLAALGAHVTLISAVGDDAEGGTLASLLASQGVAVEPVSRQPGRKTLAKHRIMAGTQMVVRFDQGNTEPPDEATESALLAALRSLVPESDVVLVSDYGYGLITQRTVEALVELRREQSFVLAVDSKRLARYRELAPTVVKPNRREAAELLGLTPPDVDEHCTVIAERAERLLELTGARIAAVTLDGDGAVIIEQGRPVLRTHARRSGASHPAGAGDSYLATFGLALACLAETSAAAQLAAATAEVVVQKEFTATCSAAELREAIAEDSWPNAELSRLLKVVESHRHQGRRIVLTNGCFDILHRGHITFLRRARALGDVLLVGVNSDESIRRLKGDSRPINCLEDRLRVLAALSCIDHLVAFHEDSPQALIREIRPDVFVKGGDYTRDTLPEASLVEQLGGRVQILPYLADRSTTRIIERIADSRQPTGGHSSPLALGTDEHGRRSVD